MSDEQINSGIGDLRDRVGNLERGLADNTRLTAGMKGDLNKLLAMLATVEGGLKVLGGLGAVLKWAAAFAASIVGLWLALKGGK